MGSFFLSIYLYFFSPVCSLLSWRPDTHPDDGSPLKTGRQDTIPDYDVSHREDIQVGRTSTVRLHAPC